MIKSLKVQKNSHYKLNKLQLLNSFLFGAIIVTSFPPMGVIIAAPIAIAVLSRMFMRANTLQEAMKYGALAGLGFGLSSFYWIFYPVHYVTQSYCLSVLGTLGVVLVFVGLKLIISICCYRIRNFPLYLLIIFNTAIWCSIEIIRSQWIFGGLPLNTIPAMWSGDIYMMQMAAFIGVYGLSFITYLLSSFLLILPLEKVSYKRKIITLGAVFGFIILCHEIGYNRVELYKTQPRLFSYVSVIQPNVAQEDKVAGLNDTEVLQDLIRTTKLVTQNRYKVLVVWPETALSSFVYPNDREILQQIQQSLLGKATLVMGALRINHREVFNSAIVTNPSLNYISFYDKVRLVPFGEYIPGENWLPFVKSSFLQNFAFSSGSEYTTFDIKGFPRFNVLVCFEVLFSNSLINYNNTDVLINISNDGWFGNSIEPYQHLAMARFRSIEGGVPLVRASNSGISAIVDSVGRVKYYLPPHTKGYLIARIPSTYPSNNMFYMWGNRLVFAINLVFMILLTLIFCRRGKIIEKSN